MKQVIRLIMKDELGGKVWMIMYEMAIKWLCIPI